MESKRNAAPALSMSQITMECLNLLGSAIIGKQAPKSSASHEFVKRGCHPGQSLWTRKTASLWNAAAENSKLASLWIRSTGAAKWKRAHFSASSCEPLRWARFCNCFKMAFRCVHHHSRSALVVLGELGPHKCRILPLVPVFPFCARLSIAVTPRQCTVRGGVTALPGGCLPES